MKKRRIIALLLITVLILLFGTTKDSEESTEADCVSSYEVNGDYKLVIIANQKKTINKRKFAERLIEQVRENDFKTIRFSYDLGGYPKGLDMIVYLDEESWEQSKSVMHISLRQDDWKDGYNIVENPDEFRLEIK